MKRVKRCPVQRINANALHHTILQEIERAAKHRTIMQRMIAEFGGWQEPDDTQKTMRGQLAKRKQFVAVQIANVSKAVAEGGSFRSLMVTLEKLETEQDAISLELVKADAEIA